MPTFNQDFIAFCLSPLSEERITEAASKLTVPDGYSVNCSVQNWGCFFLTVAKNDGTSNPFSITIAPIYGTTNRCETSISGSWRVSTSLRGAWRTECADGVDVWQFILNCIANVVDVYQKPSSTGSVKAYLDEHKIAWAWKRPSSTSIILHDGDYFLTETDPRFKKIWISETEFEYRIVDDSMEIVNFQGKKFLKSALVPIYRNNFPFSEVVKYMLPSRAEEMYEYMIVDGERRYVDIEIERSQLFRHPIHGYSTRIEQVISADKLFRKGQTDLYAKRSTEETPFLGFELEAVVPSGGDANKAANDTKRYLPEMVFCKSDSSIGGNGFETVSIPATLDYWKESALAQALDTMRLPPYNMRSFDKSTCGFHVHVSRSALSVLDLQKLERFVHNPDNREFMIAIANRAANTYQNYNDNMFKDRKSLNSVTDGGGDLRIDGILYYSIVDDLRRKFKQIGPVAVPSYSVRQRVSVFLDRVSCFINYSSMSDVLATLPEQDMLVAKYPRWVQYAGTRGFFDYLMNAHSNGLRGAIKYIAGEGDTVDQAYEKFYEFLRDVYTPLCRVSPFFAELCNSVFPDWFEVSNNNRSEPAPDFSWKAGIRKSALPFKRTQSYSASQAVKGPVGKAVVGRYDVLNTRNQATVEFRLFKGTMNSSTVFRYLEFVDAIVRFVSTTSATDEGLSYQAFVKWLVGDTFNVARYEHLVSFVVDNSWVDRKNIRRKDLPKIEAQDNKVDGLTAMELKVEEKGKRQPLGTVNIVNQQAAIEPDNLFAPVGVYDPEYDQYAHDVSEFEPIDGCDCEQCENARDNY